MENIEDAFRFIVQQPLSNSLERVGHDHEFFMVVLSMFIIPLAVMVAGCVFVCANAGDEEDERRREREKEARLKEE